MSRHYSDPARADDPHALPDIEVFEVREADREFRNPDGSSWFAPGWYWWSCFPGCLPDSDAMGPFATEAEALADAIA